MKKQDIANSAIIKMKIDMWTYFMLSFDAMDGSNLKHTESWSDIFMEAMLIRSFS